MSQPSATMPGMTRSAKYRFDAAAISVFAMGAGDMNPLHHDPEFARTTRFGGIIASGAQMAAVLMGFGATFISEHGEAVGLEFTYRFLKAVPTGTEALLSYTILSAEPHAKLGGTMLTFEGAITDDAGTRYVTSTGKAVIFDKPTVAV
ncbi:MAG: MaoC family dehydratase [Hyphomicrobium aestuarii]|nr:MaoC family dehydratase [Hyphomicrobium aestuarii]